MNRDKNILLAAFLAGAAIVWFLGTRLLPGLWNRSQTAVADISEEPALRATGVVEKGMTAGTGTSAAFRRHNWTEPPRLSARASLIADLTTGEVLLNVNPALRWPIASITKLMTAAVAIERLNGAEIIALTPEDFALGGNVQTQDLQPGNAYRVNDLLELLLVPSSNEAAEALARVYGREKFVEEMNTLASSWGLRDTHFADPAGLAAANQSTALELRTMVWNIRNAHPEVFRITEATSATVTEMKTGRAQIFLSTDQFAGRPGFLGGKTGTTPEAGENLVSIWGLAGKPVLVVIFGSSERFRDTEQLLTWFNHDFGTGN